MKNRYRAVNSLFAILQSFFLSSQLYGYELIHHRVTQSITELNRFEIKRIELRDTLCYSVVKTPFYTVYIQSLMSK